MIKKLACLVVVLSSICLATHVYGGSHEADRADSSRLLKNALFSKEVEKRIAKKRAEVAIVARLGRPLDKLPAPLQFTHVGIAIYSQIATAENQVFSGYVFYNLYQSKENSTLSYLASDSALNYFANVEQRVAGVIIPRKELQDRLKALVFSETYKRLHRPNYALLANPFDKRYQNCTEFVLDLVTSSIYETSNINQLKANQRAHFVPTSLDLSRNKIRIAGLFAPALHVRDQPGQIEIATFQSILAYLYKHRAVAESFVIKWSP